MLISPVIQKKNDLRAGHLTTGDPTEVSPCKGPSPMGGRLGLGMVIRLRHCCGLRVKRSSGLPIARDRAA